MRHLAVPFCCAVCAAFLLALLVRALLVGAGSLVPLIALAAGVLVYRTVVETRQRWPAFRAEMARRSEERRRAAQRTRFRYPDDIH